MGLMRVTRVLATRPQRTAPHVHVHVRTLTVALGLCMLPLDAHWERVQQLSDGDGEWEVVDESTELVTLDVGGARAAGIDPELGPGTEVSLTVRGLCVLTRGSRPTRRC